MSFALTPRVLGSHAFFFPEGLAFTVSGLGTAAPSTASRTAQPGATDPEWRSLGAIEEAEDDPPESERIPIFQPSPGILRKIDELETKIQSKGKITSKEISYVALQAIYRTLALTGASTQFNRLEGQLMKGWLQLQRWDQADSKRITENLWVILEVGSAIKLGGGLAEVQWQYEVLHSIYNTSAIH